MRTLEAAEKELQDGWYFDVLYDIVAKDRRHHRHVLQDASGCPGRGGVQGHPRYQTNRIQDAQEMRADLIAENDLDHTYVRPFMNVSMLEVMIAIADRLGQITGDADGVLVLGDGVESGA